MPKRFSSIVQESEVLYETINFSFNKKYMHLFNYVLRYYLNSEYNIQNRRTGWIAELMAGI